MVFFFLLFFSIDLRSHMVPLWPKFIMEPFFILHTWLQFTHEKFFCYYSVPFSFLQTNWTRKLARQSANRNVFRPSLTWHILCDTHSSWKNWGKKKRAKIWCMVYDGQILDGLLESFCVYVEPVGTVVGWCDALSGSHLRYWSKIFFC